VTDFRATGVLGLINLLYLIDRKGNSYTEIRRIYQLSCDEKQQFPFILAAFALSKTTLDAIRDGTLEYAEKNNEVFSLTVQDYFVALLRRLEERWR
jgi:hypothetical protein